MQQTPKIEPYHHCTEQGLSIQAFRRRTDILIFIIQSHFRRRYAQYNTMPPNAANASSTQVISSMHQDYIHGCAFDIYGRRMATCSGDRFVRVWDLKDSGEWSLVGEWQAHRGSVSMLSWGHPEFGSLIATCGSDHEAKIFEERTNATSAASRWTAKAQLTEARKAVSCVEFAPRHWGLKLATGSADG